MPRLGDLEVLESGSEIAGWTMNTVNSAFVNVYVLSFNIDIYISACISLVDPRGHEAGVSKERDCTPSIISHPLISSDVLDNATTPLNT